MDWDDLRFFLALARSRTLSAAARELRVAQPTVGRRVGALEQRLGAKLFTRTPTGYQLTSAGAGALAFAERMERDAFAAERQLAGRDEGVRGSVNVTASEWLISSVLPPLVPPLLARHPQLRLRLIADVRHLNLARREADIAIRPRRFEQRGVLQRSVGRLGFGLYATRGYLELHGTPAAGDGRDHVLIAMNEETGDAARDWLSQALPRATRSVETNGRDAMLALARTGIGLACLARIVGDAAPELVRVALPGPPAPALWIGSHADARDTPRVGVVGRHLAEQLRALGPRLCPGD